MTSPRLSPLASLLAFARLALARRLHFPRRRVGQTIWLDGEPWVVFRHMVVDPLPAQLASAGAIFRPRFHVAGMSVGQNLRFSILPIPFFAGLPGFRTKLWLYNSASGDFSGYYEWDTVADAENYSRSFAARFMTRRSVPGSVSFKILPCPPSPGS